jgi:hypothetical protein
MLAMQILVDGFVISAIYGLGAIGFTIIFGVSGVLNLAHGGILVTAAMMAWWAALAMGRYWGALVGVGSGIAAAYLTYYVVVRPIKMSRKIPEVEKEIFILTATLLWAIMIQAGIAYLFTSNPITVRPLVSGVTHVFGIVTPTNELLIGVVCWLIIGLLWVFVNVPSSAGPCSPPRSTRAVLPCSDLTSKGSMRLSGVCTGYWPASPVCYWRPLSERARTALATSPRVPSRSWCSVGWAACRVHWSPLMSSALSKRQPHIW